MISPPRWARWMKNPTAAKVRMVTMRQLRTWPALRTLSTTNRVRLSVLVLHTARRLCEIWNQASYILATIETKFCFRCGFPLFITLILLSDLLKKKMSAPFYLSFTCMWLRNLEIIIKEAGFTVLSTGDSCDIWLKIVCMLLCFSFCFTISVFQRWEKKGPTKYELFSLNFYFVKWMFAFAIVWIEPAVTSLLPQ